MFTAEKTMFRPPGDVSKAARILGKNNVCLTTTNCKAEEGGKTRNHSVWAIIERRERQPLLVLADKEGQRVSFFEKKESGALEELRRYCRTVLKWVLEASTTRLMGKLAWGCSSLATVAKAALAA